MRKLEVLSVVIAVLLISSFAFSAPGLYLADDSGTPITQITASVGQEVVVYVFGRTDEGNPYDSFNLSLAYDPLDVSPRTGTAEDDLVMSGVFGMAMANQITTYSGVSLLNAAETSLSGPPAGFDATLLATAHFTFLDGPTDISLFDEADEYTYSTFFMDSQTYDDVRFSGTVTIVPEPLTVGLLVMGVFGLVKRRRAIR